MVKIVLNKTGRPLRQPVLGSIPRRGAPEIASKREISRAKLVRCTGRVMRAAVRQASMLHSI